MSLVEFRAAGDSTRFDLEWKDSAGVAVNLGDFSSIVLRLERVGFVVLELPVFIDDGPNGLGHFRPTAAEIIEGTHYYQIKGVVTATSEEQYFPKDEPVTLKVSRALEDLS